MEQPYRTPGVAAEPPPRIETLRLRRYPVWIQVFWLMWCPLVAVVVGQLLPSVSLVCEPSARSGGRYCTIDEERLSGTRRYVLADENAVWVREGPDDVISTLPDTADLHLMMTATLEGCRCEPERFLFELDYGAARRIKQDLQSFANDPRPRTERSSLRQSNWLYGLCAATELATLLFYFVRQRQIRIEINADNGKVLVDDRRSLRRSARRAFELCEITQLEIAFLGEEGSHGRRVTAKIGEDRHELFEAFDAEAERGFHFLERVHARWKMEHA